MPESRIPKFVSFANGGDVVYYSANCRCSGYGTPDRPHAAHPEEMPDGTPVIDKRPALETAAGYAWVFRGPMLNPDLPDDQFDPCPAPSLMFAEAMAQSSTTFAGMLALQKCATTERGPLDQVSIAEYVAGWKERGARSGRYLAGAIVWDD